jgi:hypothetical protein
MARKVYGMIRAIPEGSIGKIVLYGSVISQECKCFKEYMTSAGMSFVCGDHACNKGLKESAVGGARNRRGQGIPSAAEL